MDADARKDFIKKVQIVTAIVTVTVLLILLFVKAVKVFLLVFAGMMVAIFFRSIAHLFSKKTGLSIKITLPVSVLAVLAIWVGIYFLLAPKVTRQ